MKKIIILGIFVLTTVKLFSQSQVSKDDAKSILNFEEYIISGIDPKSIDIQIKYETDYRVIVWKEPLTKSYKYSNEQFDKLGYEFVQLNEGDNQHSSKVYRNCKKGIVIEVTEWYGIKLSISMEWYDPNVRRSIGYLMYCNIDNKNVDSENKIKGILYMSNFYGKEGNSPYDNPTREKAEVFIGGNIIKVSLGNNSTTYKFYKKYEESESTTYLIYLGDISNITSKHPTAENEANSFLLTINKHANINETYYSLFLNANIPESKILWIPEAKAYNYEISK